MNSVTDTSRCPQSINDKLLFLSSLPYSQSKSQPGLEDPKIKLERGFFEALSLPKKLEENVLKKIFYFHYLLILHETTCLKTQTLD
jgi:hypothetical protein